MTDFLLLWAVAVAALLVVLSLLAFFAAGFYVIAYTALAWPLKGVVGGVLFLAFAGVLAAAAAGWAR